MMASDDNPYGGAAYGGQNYQQNTHYDAAPSPEAAAQAEMAPLAPPAANIFDVTTADFGTEVMQRSMDMPVIVDFWAPWCGPCKQLTPILEAAIQAQGGKVLLAKMNIDDYPEVAGQMGVQSIPAVVAFHGGQPADAFMGSVPASEAQAFVQKIAQLAGEKTDPIEDMLEMAKTAFDDGVYEQAAQAYSAVVQAKPQNIIALAGLAESVFELGRVEDAEQVLNSVPADKRQDALFIAIDAKMRLAKEVAALGDPKALEDMLAQDENNHQARFDLAAIRNVQGDREAAADGLLTIMRKDREWQDDAARLRLLELFDAWGPTDPATLSARRRLSSLLFS